MIIEFFINKIILFREFGIFFDGTPHCGELIGIIVRYVLNWEVKQVLIGVRHTSHSLDSIKLGNVLNSMITSADKGMATSMDKVIGIGRDSASVNGSMTDGLAAVLINEVTVNCKSHALSRTGQAMILGKFGELVAFWNMLFAHSGNVPVLWFYILSFF